MACLIFAESAIFTIFVVAYLYYVGKSLTGPTPREVLETPHFLHHLSVVQQSDDPLCGKNFWNAARTRRIPALMAVNDRSGCPLSVRHGSGMAQIDLRNTGLTISTNLFGTTYYSLVGLHAFHVTAGLVMLRRRAVLRIGQGRVWTGAFLLASTYSRLYWHFVDAVWVVVFTVCLRSRPLRRRKWQRSYPWSNHSRAPGAPAEIEVAGHQPRGPLFLGFRFHLDVRRSSHERVG